MVAATQPLTQSAKVTARALIALGVILAIALTLRLVFFIGILCTDDMATWQLGKSLADGHLAPAKVLQNDISTRRYGPAIPAAVCFKLFGVSETTVMIYPILASLAGIVIVWDLTRRLAGSLWAAHFAALLLATSVLDIDYSTVALPDGPMAAVSLAALWCIVLALSADRSAAGQRVLLLLSGLLLAFALAHKESAIQLVGAVGLWGLLLMFSRQFRPTLWLILVGFLVGVAAEHVLFWAAYGDPFDRWEVMVRGLESSRNKQLLMVDELPRGKSNLVSYRA